MPATGGYFPGGGSTTAASGALQVSILDYGGAADGSTNNVGPFNDAKAAAKALLGANSERRTASIYFPGGESFYATNEPLLLDEPFISIVGDEGQTDIRNGGYGPVVVVGIRAIDDPNGTPIKLTSANWPSRTGKLDGTLGGYGVRLVNGASSIIFHGTPFNYGIPATNASHGMGNWENIRELTFSIAMEKADGSTGFTGSNVEGIIIFGGIDSDPIFRFQKGGVAGQFDLYFTDSGGNAGSVGVATTPAAGVLKLDIQISLITKTAQAWENGVQVATNPQGAAFGGGGTGYWKRSDRDAFIIGCDTQTTDGRVPMQQPSLVTNDIAIYGLVLDSALRYENRGVGQTQRRLDNNTAPDDAYRYGGYGPSSLIGRLWDGFPALDPSNPNYDADNPYTCRLVGVFQPSSFKLGYGYFCQNALMNATGGQEGNSIVGCKLRQVDDRLGPIVHIGPVLRFTIENCYIQNGCDGVSQIPSVASYPVRVRNTQISAKRYPFDFSFTVAELNGIDIHNSGRVAVMSWASNVKTQDVIVYGLNEWCDYLIYADNGPYGMVSNHKNWFVDAEGLTGCRLGAFRFEQQDSLTTSVIMDDMDVQGASNSVPGFYLIGASGTPKQARIRAQMVKFSDAQQSAAAIVTGEDWYGTIEIVPTNGAGITFTHEHGSGENVSVVT